MFPGSSASKLHLKNFTLEKFHTWNISLLYEIVGTASNYYYNDDLQLQITKFDLRKRSRCSDRKNLLLISVVLQKTKIMVSNIAFIK